MAAPKQSEEGLTPAQRADLADLISRRMIQLRREVALAKNIGESGQMQVTAASDADRGVADVDGDLALASLHRDQSELSALAAARRRIDEGNYGFCAKCGNNIEYERLLAAPFALRCLSCQSAYEKQSGRSSSTL